MSENSICSYPVVDEDPQRIANIVVDATSAKQGNKIKDFEEKSVATFNPTKKR